MLAGAVVIANLAENFSIGRITLKDDRMVVETPSYSGVTGDGTSYSVTALSAEAGLTAMDAVSLNGATRGDRWIGRRRDDRQGGARATSRSPTKP